VISFLTSTLELSLFLLIAVCAGPLLIVRLATRMYSEAEYLLCCAALGVILIQLVVSLALLTNHFRLALILGLLFIGLVGLKGFRTTAQMISRIFLHAWNAPRLERLLSSTAVLVILIQYVAAMAPLTASDALHYHFAVPAQILQKGFHADFFLSHSFFCGQSHTLILLGLALGGEKFAMGLVFVGGILAAAAIFCLARRWINLRWAWVITLTFLLTPVVFWHLASPGAPDLWMSFFTVLAVLVISRMREFSGMVTTAVMLAGCLAGAIAGAKYTGCFVAASLLVALMVELRSFSSAVIFTVASLAAGFWPYLRNIVWAGDPFFPFLLPRISPDHVNSSALSSYLADTTSGIPKSIFQFVEFLFFARIDPGRLGFFQFFGPLVLALSPLLFRSVRNTPLWRVILITWSISATVIGIRSGMARFSLPIFPLAITAVIASSVTMKSSKGKVLRLLAVTSIVLFLSAGFFGLLVYVRNPLRASLGLISRENYLREYAPDYQAEEFTNRFFENQPTNGNVLVFMRHVYHLKIPFLYGDPKASWAIDPSRLQNPEQWRTFLSKNNITWVVRSPSYPASISVPLDDLEKSGALMPRARTEVENFTGKRMSGVRERSEVVILQVMDEMKSSSANKEDERATAKLVLDTCLSAPQFKEEGVAPGGQPLVN
jgi:hypothetical protein